MRGAGALAGRARVGRGERVRQAERDEAEGWAARERVGRGWTEREVWAERRSIAWADDLGWEEGLRVGLLTGLGWIGYWAVSFLFSFANLTQTI